MNKTLFLGYGNPDRGDDGVAWHILSMLFAEFGNAEIDMFDMDVNPLTKNIDTWFNLQLLPEISELIVKYEKAVFIDAHTGEIKNDLNFQEIKPAYQNAPFTHHMTPASLLAVAESIHGNYPQSWLVSVRGYAFRFEQVLTAQTEALCKQAVNLLKQNFIK
jgi:hydrogenase maturation protease